MRRKCYMLDTNVCAFWLRDKYGVKDRVNAVGMENCYISEVTVAELKFGKVYGRLKGVRNTRTKGWSSSSTILTFSVLSPTSTSTPRRRHDWNWQGDRRTTTSTCSSVAPPSLKT